jgi:hypothetical protein
VSQNNRKTPRLPTNLRAAVATQRDAGYVRGRLLNISMHGACFMAKKALEGERGDHVTMAFYRDQAAVPALVVKAVVRWRDGETIGVEFDEAIDLKALQ